MTNASPDYATGVRVVPIGPDDVDSSDGVDGSGPTAPAEPSDSQEGEATASVTNNSRKADIQQESTDHYQAPTENSAKTAESGGITAEEVRTTSDPSPPIGSPDEASTANDPLASAASSSPPNTNSVLSEPQALQTGFKTHRGLACLDDHRETASIDSAGGCQELCILRTWCNGFSFNTRRKRYKPRPKRGGGGREREREREREKERGREREGEKTRDRYGTPLDVKFYQWIEPVS